MNEIATIGHNQGPDPIDEITAAYADTLAEAENWLDATEVETEDQMKVVDALIKDMRAARSDLKKAREGAVKPLYDAYKAEGARWKPTEEDFDRISKGLAAAVDGFKRKLKEQKDAERRAAEAEARKAREEAERKAREANEADLQAQREAAATMRAAEEAQAAAQKAQKDSVKGLRKVTRYAIDDHREALHWIARQDRAAVTAFVEDYVRRNHKSHAIDGVRVWQVEEAY